MFDVLMLIRAAQAADAAILTEIVNRVITNGGTTAHQTLFSVDRMLRTYVAPDRLVSCHVAEVGGAVIGLQSLSWPDTEGQTFPEHWAIIATFVDPNSAGSGAGTALFSATRDAATKAGVRAIDATIRADNSGGLAYYTRMGFEDYDILPAVPLRDGRLVDRVRKKFAL